MTWSESANEDVRRRNSILADWMDGTMLWFNSRRSQSKQNFLISSLNDRIPTASIVTFRLMIDMCHHTIQMRRKLPDDAHCTHKGSAIHPIQIALIHLARRSVWMYLCNTPGAYQQAVFKYECFNVCKTVDDPITTATTTVATGWMNDENLNLNWIKFEFVKLSSGI